MYIFSSSIYIYEIFLIIFLDLCRVVLPLVIREVTSIFLGHFGTVDANESLALSMFGFLYGMIPSAPAVFVYASAYNLEMDLVC